MNQQGSNNDGDQVNKNSAKGEEPVTFDPMKANAGAVNPLDLLRDRLEGRWTLTISLALVVGIVAAFISFLLAPVYYRATGYLQGTSEHEIIIAEIAETESRTFDLFLMGQVELLKSGHVIRHAAESEKLEEVVKERGFYPFLNEIENGVIAVVPDSTQLIRVQFDDQDADVSALVTNAIMESYIELHGMDSGDSISRKEGYIRQFKKENRAAAESKRSQQQGLIRNSRYGTAELSPLISDHVTNMEILRTAEENIDETIMMLEESARAQGREISGKEIPDPKDAELNQFEPSLQALRGDLEKAVVLLDQMSTKLTEEHRLYKSQQGRINSLNSILENRVAEAKERWKVGPGQQQSFEKLVERKARIADQIAQKRDEIAEMNDLRDRFDGLQREISILDDDYSNLDDRLRELQYEQPAIKDSVQIVEWATPPLQSETDKTLQVSAAAFATGVLVVFGAFFLLGSIDQRAFAFRQLQSDKGVFQCLGVIPNTSPSSSDPEAVDSAMTCVHRLRNKIESIRHQKEDGYVLLVTSPFQGDGKTTIASLLGWSYSNAGYKTCMVDCDFIGRSLSHQFDKLDKHGIREALKKGKLGRLPLKLGDENLSILPIGIDDTVHPEHMQFNKIDPILTELRQGFEIIIIDTGPMSGSLESIPIASAVDGVILTLRKGRSRLPLRRCVQELHDLRASYLGVVLNYAEKADYRNFSTKSKSIDDLLKEDEAGIREKNPLMERIATDPSQTKSETTSSDP